MMIFSERLAVNTVCVQKKQASQRDEERRRQEGEQKQCRRETLAKRNWHIILISSSI